MRVHEVLKRIVTLRDEDDASRIFGRLKGFISAGDLRKLLNERHPEDSVALRPSGDGVRVFFPGKFSI